MVLNYGIVLARGNDLSMQSKQTTQVETILYENNDSDECLQFCVPTLSNIASPLEEQSVASLKAKYATRNK